MRIEDLITKKGLRTEERINFLHNYEVIYNQIFPLKRYVEHQGIRKKDLNNIKQKSLYIISVPYTHRLK